MDYDDDSSFEEQESINPNEKVKEMFDSDYSSNEDEIKRLDSPDRSNASSEIERVNQDNSPLLTELDNF